MGDFLYWVGDGIIRGFERFFRVFGNMFRPSLPEKKRRQSGARFGVYIFTIFLTIMSLMAMYLPLRPTYSEKELRNLAEFPKPTVKTFFNGDFFAGVDTWFSDTFPNRDSFITLSSKVEALYGQQSMQIHGNVMEADEIATAPMAPGQAVNGQTTPEGSPAPADPNAAGGTNIIDSNNIEDMIATMEETTEAPVETEPVLPIGEVPELSADAKVEKLGACLVIDNAAYEYYNFVLDTANQYISALNQAATMLDGIATVYNILIPTSIDMCVPASLRENVYSSDQAEAINYFYTSYDSRIHTVNIYNTILSHALNGEYMYFRTDHHWTALSAYYAYRDLMTAMGKTPASLEDDFIPYEIPGFLGSFYRSTNSAAMAATPDTVYAWEPKSTNDIFVHWQDGTQTDYHIITDTTEWSSGVRYSSTFIGGDSPYSVIHNPNITDGSSILVIKDSYGICFVPFLVESFEYVYTVDFRYFHDTETGNLKDLVVRDNIQNVLFLNTISTTRAENLVPQLLDFVVNQY